jgi:membrane protease YdiL (CAAX protease family)
MNSNRILVEALLIMALAIGGGILFPDIKLVFSLLPVAYLLIERRLRQRAWAEIGFKREGFWADLRANAGWVLVAILSQGAVMLWALSSAPGFLAHLSARMPASATALLGLLPVLALAILGEEMSYRALLQDRLVPFVGAPVAILLASLAFGLAHFNPGPAVIVTLDVGLIVVDALFYGLIYERSHNIYIAWLAHFLGDVLALELMVSPLVA